MNKPINAFRFVSILGGVIIILFSVFFDYMRGSENDGFGIVQRVGVLVGVILIISSLVKSFWYYIFLSVFIFGAFLSLVNIYGEGVSLRDPKVNEGSYFHNKFRKPQLTPEQAFDQITRGKNEAYEEYASRLTELVYSATIHKWEDVVDPSEYNHRVPFRENYILWALSYLEPKTYQRYQFCDPYKAIERGAMICSQVTEVMVRLWRDETALKARNRVLDGHVVAEVQIDEKKNTWWILDADFGVVLKYDLATLEKHPEIVVESYTNAGYDINVAETLAAIYGKNGNYTQVNTEICRAEKKYYEWKWYFPLFLLAVSSIYFGCVWIIRRQGTA